MAPIIQGTASVKRKIGGRTALINELGNTYDWLTVTGSVKTATGKTLWMCKCKCGKTVERDGKELRRKRHFHSCGCYHADVIRRKLPTYTHGHSNK